ncbi:hypothetical protein WJX73_007978 [Symbiochloris irregularis]|uniref:Uncharacterized protein n=1 Tax=Symbiochloris irregularis TaxID=706552 RepID=A0AAW1PBB0_9CHLO
MRRRGDRLRDLLQEDEPLDSVEQQELVQELEKQQEQQSKIWAVVWTAILLLTAASYSALAWHQAAYPWHMKHHANFYDTLGVYTLAAGEACSGLSLLPATWAIRRGLSSSAQIAGNSATRAGFIMP